MGYPKKLLADGESIVFELRPHWRAILWPIILLLLVVFAAAFLSFWLAAMGNLFGTIVMWIVIGAGLLVVIIWAFVPFLRWISSQYVFTDRRIIVRTGIIAKEGRDMPLSKVNNVTFRVSVMGRILNYGELNIQSASEDSGLDVKDVPNVEMIQREIYRLHEEDDARRRGVGGTPLPSDGT